MSQTLKKKKGSYHHKNLRAALLTLTRQIIAEEGVEQVTLRELARRLNVSRTAPYRHFKDKSTLLAAVAKDSFTKLNLELLRDFENAVTPLDQLRHMMCHYVRFAVANPDHYKLMFGNGFNKSDYFPELAEVADETFAILAQAIFQCQEHRMVVEGDPNHQAYVVWSAVHGLANLIMDGKLSFTDPNAFAEFVSQTMLHGLMSRTDPLTSS